MVGAMPIIQRSREMFVCVFIDRENIEKNVKQELLASPFGLPPSRTSIPQGFAERSTTEVANIAIGFSRKELKL